MKKIYRLPHIILSLLFLFGSNITYANELESDLENAANSWLISIKNGPQSGSLCKGFLVDNHWAITSAHCISSMDSRSIFIEETNSSNPQLSQVQLVSYHEDYNFENFSGDIVLLYSKEAFDLEIPPLLLNYEDFKEIPNGETIELLQFDKDDLLESVSLIYDSTCEEGNNTKFCAKSTSNLCFGDSGTPVIYQNKYIIGIISYGATNCKKDETVVFSNISSMSSYPDINNSWIETHTHEITMGSSYTYIDNDNAEKSIEISVYNGSDNDININTLSIHESTDDFIEVNNHCDEWLSSHEVCSFEVSFDQNNTHVSELYDISLNANSNKEALTIETELFVIYPQDQEFTEQVNQIKTAGGSMSKLFLYLLILVFVKKIIYDATKKQC